MVYLNWICIVHFVSSIKCHIADEIPAPSYLTVITNLYVLFCPLVNKTLQNSLWKAHPFMICFFLDSFILLENISWLKLKEEKTVLINVFFRNKVPKVAEEIHFDSFKTKKSHLYVWNYFSIWNLRHKTYYIQWKWNVWIAQKQNIFFRLLAHWNCTLSVPIWNIIQILKIFYTSRYIHTHI